MNRIQKSSRFFKWVFKIIFVLLPIIYGIFWVHAPAPFSFPIKGFGLAINLIPDGISIMQPLSVNTKILAAIISLIPLSINLLIVFFIIKLFKNFQQNKEIFSLKNVACIKKIGVWILLKQLIGPIYEILISMTVTWHNPVGHRVAMISFGLSNLGLILTAILIILISWIMAEGYKLQEENQYTI